MNKSIPARAIEISEELLNIANHYKEWADAGLPSARIKQLAAQRAHKSVVEFFSLFSEREISFGKKLREEVGTKDV